MRTVGIKLADGSFYPIMEEGSAQKKTLELTTAHNNQTCVMVDLYRSKTCSMEDAEYIDTLKIENLNEHPNGEPSISFDVDLNEDGELSYSIADPETGTTSNSEMTLVSRTEEERQQADDYSIEDAVADDVVAEEEEMPVEEEAVAEEEVAAEDDDSGNGAAIAAGAAVAGAGLLAAAAIASNKDDDDATIADDELPDFEEEAPVDEGLASFDAGDETFEEAPAEDATIADDATFDTDELPAFEEAPADDTILTDDATVADDTLPDFDETTITEDAAPADDDTFNTDDLPDFDETPAEDATVADDTTIAEDSMGFADISSDDDTTLEDATLEDTPADDSFEMPDFDDEPAPVAETGGMDFSGLYDKETEMGNSSENQDDDFKKKTRAPVIICIICAIICLIATALVLLVLPTKFNLRLRHSQKNQDTAVEKTAEAPKEKKTKEKKEDPVPAAKEDEVVVIEKAEDVKPVPPPTAETKPAGVTYKIKWGDTLWDIADTYYKNPWRYKKIASYNGIKNPDHIISGTVITIPSE